MACLERQPGRSGRVFKRIPILGQDRDFACRSCRITAKRNDPIALKNRDRHRATFGFQRCMTTSEASSSFSTGCYETITFRENSRPFLKWSRKLDLSPDDSRLTIAALTRATQSPLRSRPQRSLRGIRGRGLDPEPIIAVEKIPTRQHPDSAVFTDKTRTSARLTRGRFPTVGKNPIAGSFIKFQEENAFFRRRARSGKSIASPDDSESGARFAL
jgi:hypothetical protein